MTEGDMYCPKCGSENQSEVKFCTRCGTNLAIVTDALSGRLGSSVIDERIMKLIKAYNAGRRDFITGSVLIPAAMLIWMILGLTKLGFMPSFFIICWMFFWGIPSLAVGISKMLAASSEMKAFGYDLKQGFIAASALRQSLPVAHDENVISPTNRLSTDPLDFPGSATEQTTRQLEEKIYRPPVEKARRSK